MAKISAVTQCRLNSAEHNKQREIFEVTWKCARLTWSCITYWKRILTSAWLSNLSPKFLYAYYHRVVKKKKKKIFICSVPFLMRGDNYLSLHFLVYVFKSYWWFEAVKQLRVKDWISAFWKSDLRLSILKIEEHSSYCENAETWPPTARVGGISFKWEEQMTLTGVVKWLDSKRICHVTSEKDDQSFCCHGVTA